MCVNVYMNEWMYEWMYCVYISSMHVYVYTICMYMCIHVYIIFACMYICMYGWMNLCSYTLYMCSSFCRQCTTAEKDFFFTKLTDNRNLKERTHIAVFSWMQFECAGV